MSNQNFSYRFPIITFLFLRSSAKKLRLRYRWILLHPWFHSHYEEVLGRIFSSLAYCCERIRTDTLLSIIFFIAQERPDASQCNSSRSKRIHVVRHYVGSFSV